MMLDVTGSMGGQKIKDLKAAAENAVEALLDGQDPKSPRVRVAIVPYAEAVNTGKLADAVFVEKEGGSNLPPAIDKPVSVSAEDRPDNCATERKDKDGAADFSDDGPYTERKNKKGKIYLARVNRDDRLQSVPESRTGRADRRQGEAARYDRRFQGRRRDGWRHRGPVGLLHAVAQMAVGDQGRGPGRRPRRP